MGSLRLIRLELREAWQLHGARSYDQRLRAALPYVEDLLSALESKAKAMKCVEGR